MTAQAFRPLAGPFTKAEAWMLANIITDLNRSDIGWRGDAIDIEAEVQEVVEQ